MFFIRDPVKFPSLNRSHKQHPGTNTSNGDMFWDFHVNSQESIHALMFLFGDRGLPSSVRHVNAYSGNTYKFTKADGSYHYVRIHLISNQGIHYFTNAEGAQIAGSEPDRHLLDLQDSIKSGDFPSWNVCVQTIHPNQIPEAPIDIFDMTKVWPHSLYPLRKAGRLQLKRNPSNWFTEIEAAFSPSNMVPGIEPSPDQMLQARMFAYPDAARYRLGVNYQSLPTDAPRSEVYCPIERDGRMNFTKNYGTDPNYIGTRLKPVNFVNKHQDLAWQESSNQPDEKSRLQNGGAEKKTADHVYATTPIPVALKVAHDDFEQATALWGLIGKQDGAQSRFVDNLAAHVSSVETK